MIVEGFMAVEVGVKRNFYGYFQFPTYQGLSEKVAGVANVVKDIARIGLDICIPLYVKAVGGGYTGYVGNSTCEMAMERAARHGHTVAVKFFLNRASIQDGSLEHALRDAVSSGHLEAVKIILQDVQDKRGHLLDPESSESLVIQLFRIAVNYRQIEVAKFFLKQFPHPQLESYFLLQMELNWEFHRKFEKLKFLLECCDQTCYRETGIKQAFKTAARLEDPSMLQYMLEYFQISEEDFNGALSSIVRRGLSSQFRCIRLLLPKSSQKGCDEALIASSQCIDFYPHVFRSFLKRSSQEGRKRALDMALPQAHHREMLNLLLPSMPIPDRFLRAAIKRCGSNRIAGGICEPFSKENALKKGAKLLAFRVHIAKRLVDSSKLPLTGKCSFGPDHPNHFIWSKRQMPVIMNRIFYGHQDLFKATHLLVEMH